MTLREILPSETSFIQLGKGRIAAGTGAFTDQDFVGRIAYTVAVKG